MNALQPISILIVDDDPSLARVLEHHLQEAGYQVSKCLNSVEGLERLDREKPDILFSDLRMPGLNGHELLQQAKAKHSELLVIMLTGFPTLNDAIEAMRHGAYDFLQKPVDRGQLLRVVGKAADLIALRRENERLRSLVDTYAGFGGLVGEAPQLRRVIAQAKQVAESQAPVLVLGETGTGKELLAKAIHSSSPRHAAPFIAINCSAIPAELMESELFGHMKGAFTGAIQNRPGRIQAAAGGTLFLDEVGDLPLSLQPKLLRVLQEKQVEPIGSHRGISVDFRLIAATHRDLAAMVQAGTFREDLYYRLNVIPLTLPPLRERREDIPLLFMRLLKRECEREGRLPPQVTPELLQALTRAEWPGNVRELENLARRLLALNHGTTLTLTDWKETENAFHATGPLTSSRIGAGFPQKKEGRPVLDVDSLPDFDLPESGLDLEGLNDAVVVKALQMHQSNQSATARYLGISRNSLIYRMEKRGLQRE
jgi:DNA-binding NtrC family response regulator